MKRQYRLILEVEGDGELEQKTLRITAATSEQDAIGQAASDVMERGLKLVRVISIEQVAGTTLGRLPLVVASGALACMLMMLVVFWMTHRTSQARTTAIELKLDTTLERLTNQDRYFESWVKNVNTQLELRGINPIEMPHMPGFASSTGE